MVELLQAGHVRLRLISNTASQSAQKAAASSGIATVIGDSRAKRLAIVPSFMRRRATSPPATLTRIPW